MPNIINTLKREIDRLAAKQAESQIGTARKAVAKYRHEVAELKRLLRQQEHEIRLLKKAGSVQSVEEDPLAGVRFSSRSVRSQRQRLGLSAADYAKLVGVSPLAVRHWESGRSRPRKAQLAALVSVRGISKDEALRRLAAKG